MDDIYKSEIGVYMLYMTIDVARSCELCRLVTKKWNKFLSGLTLAVQLLSVSVEASPGNGAASKASLDEVRDKSSRVCASIMNN